ncbi:hypothetical protein H5410_027214 [Solanum commersonii]|uniref:Uncharacterized protein n=1 Tax=Solanum commersonii TaxID=4109 RepID=A0A9J5YZ89_SOLCO|nr:hypothetical protein H5410_027214 [Solanum commersonii]
MIPYSRTKVNRVKIRNQMQRSHSKRGTQCMFLSIGLPLFSNRLSIRLTQYIKVFIRLVIGMSAKF